MAETQALEVTIISKMSVKTLRCNPRQAAVADGQPQLKIPLCRIYGRVSGTKTQEDAVSGVFHTALMGVFEGLNLVTGEVFRSGKLYLPKGIHEMLETPAKKLDADDKGETVSFALEISSVSATNPIGYSYEAKPLIKVAVTDELDELRSALPAYTAPKALAAENPAPEKSKGSKK